MGAGNGKDGWGSALCAWRLLEVAPVGRCHLRRRLPKGLTLPYLNRSGHDEVVARQGRDLGNPGEEQGVAKLARELRIDACDALGAAADKAP